ncbi:MAG: hypothetical protein H7841_18115 [Magnetospirillum sp. WYHS-4]
MTHISAVDSQRAEWLRNSQGSAAGQAFRMTLDGSGIRSGGAEGPQGLSGLGRSPVADPAVLAESDAEATEASGLGNLLDKAADTIGSAFGYLREIGVTVTETIVLKWNSAGAYEVYANRSCSVSACYAGQEDASLQPHPEGDLLEGILNGGLPGFEDLTRQIQEFFAEADAMVDQFISEANQMREDSGQSPLPFETAWDYWKSLPNGLEIPLDQLAGDGDKQEKAA